MANYTIRQFQGEVGKWIARVETGLDDVIREFAKAVHADLVRNSPVDTGRFRANWQITANVIPMFALNEYDKTGEKTIAAGKRIINALPLGRGGAVTSIHFSNMLIYANALEYGHSKQAPAGVVGIINLRLRSYMANAIKASRLKNGV